MHSGSRGAHIPHLPPLDPPLRTTVLNIYTYINIKRQKISCSNNESTADDKSNGINAFHRVKTKHLGFSSHQLIPMNATKPSITLLGPPYVNLQIIKQHNKNFTL